MKVGDTVTVQGSLAEREILAIDGTKAWTRCARLNGEDEHRTYPFSSLNLVRSEQPATTDDEIKVGDRVRIRGGSHNTRRVLAVVGDHLWVRSESGGAPYTTYATDHEKVPIYDEWWANINHNNMGSGHRSREVADRLATPNQRVAVLHHRTDGTLELLEP